MGVDADGAKKFYSSLSKEMKNNIAKALDTTTLKLHGEAQKEVPVDKGFLKNSHIIEIVGPLTRSIRVLADYGSFVHWGTRRQGANPWMDRAINTTVRWLNANGATLIKITT